MFKFRTTLRCAARLQLRQNHFNAEHLQQCAANYAPLTPITTFQRSALLSPTEPAYVYEDTTRTWGEVSRRVRAFAHALVKLGIQRGDVVSIMCPNTPPIFESHFAIPGAGAVLHAVNTRLDAATIAYQLEHAGTKVFLVDSEYDALLEEVKTLLVQGGKFIPHFISIQDPHYQSPTTPSTPSTPTLEYEAFIAQGDTSFSLLPCLNEWDAISLNYTSGTTGNPKGVVYHYRGAYLNSVANVVEWNMEKNAKFLWIVPMFHCNGWVFPWSLSVNSGCSFLLRQVRPKAIFDLINKHQIGYLCGAPITMGTMLAYPQRNKFSHSVKMWAAGAPPPPSVIKQFTEELGIVTQTAYGLTETYGPISSHLPDPEWHTKLNLSEDKILQLCTLQAQDSMLHGMTVRDSTSMQEVPADGTTMGEVMIRGNSVMKGYLKNPSATAEAFEGGWFRTGDLGVNHGNGRLEIKDRSKDIIISGGENISSIEVENIMMTHPMIGEIAVVAMPHEKWGEVPCAFITLKVSLLSGGKGGLGVEGANSDALEKQLLAWAKTKMAAFQAPKRIVFCQLPKTSTGKVQKNLLKKLL